MRWWVDLPVRAQTDVYRFFRPFRLVQVKRRFLMWPLFHFGWLFLLVALAMMVVCVLMFARMCRHGASSGGRCCGHTHSDERQH
jgi:hypothetical protein